MSDTPQAAPTAAPVAAEQTAPAQAPAKTAATSIPDLANAISQVAPSDWRANLPEELRANPSLAKYKDVAELAKGHVNAQSLIGKKGLEKPSEDWKPEQWDGFYKEIGRPDKAEDYKFETPLPEGWSKDENMEKYFTAEMHKSGLTQKQAASMHEKFVEFQVKTYQEKYAKSQQEQELGIARLRQEFGDAYPAYEESAFRAAREYGGQELAEVLRANGLGSHPVILKTFAKMGMQMAEDSLKTGRGGSTFTVGKDAALAQIGNLKADGEFWKAFNDSSHPQHKEQAKRWNDLHKLAFS